MRTALKILILEDSEFDADMIQRLLKKEKMHCEFKVAMNKKDFIQAFDDFSPDIILSDNSLPQFNSSEALKIARQRSPHIPFILVTGTVTEEFAADIIKSGADDYILKDRMSRLPTAIIAALNQRSAGKALADYRYALDQSASVIIADSNGIILYANDFFCKLSQYLSGELIGQTYEMVDCGYHSASFIRYVWTTITNGKIWRGEFCTKAKDGSSYWVDTTITPFLDEKGSPYQYLAICVNITDQKRAEENLRQSELRLNEAQTITHISNWDVDLLHDVHTWSDELYKIYGINKNDVRPSVELFLSFMHPDNAEQAQKKIRASLDSFNGTSLDFRFIRVDGKTRHGYAEWDFEFDKQGKPLRLFGVLQDVTERKEAEEELKSLGQEMMNQKVKEQKKITRAIIKAQESERNYIGQELHDNVNQIIATAKLYLTMASDDKIKIKELITYAIELLDSSISEIRLLTSKQVTPTRDINLQEMVQSLLDEIANNTTIETIFLYNILNEVVEDELKLNIYRIIQEQLNNIMKHAAPKNVKVSIEASDKAINISVKDDGKGFDTTHKRKGIGISNMINRIQSFDGDVAIESSPGNGCAVQIKIPY